MKQKLLLFISFLLIAAQFTFGQGKRQYFDAYEATGDTCMAHNNFYGAHQSYEKALEYINDIDVAFKCADACRQYQNYPDAEKYYRMALAEDSASFPNAKFFYAEMLKYQGKYKEAYAQYYEFYKLNRRERTYFVKRAKIEYRNCKKKVYTIPNIESLKYERIDNDTMNTMYSEYSPVQYNDSIFFFNGIRATDTVLADTAYIFDNYWNRVSSAILKDTVYTDIKLEDGINEDGYHIGNLSFNRAGDVVYYSKCKDYNCEIYRAKFDVNTREFTEKERLPAIINAPGSVSSTPYLAVTPTGEILFFSSNRKGKGKAGMLDIWYSFINEDGSFEKPLSIGKKINTISNDVTPYYDAGDSLLYFSTESHLSLGGYDVFSTKVDWVNKRWSKPQNVGQPINSSYNDLYYSHSRDSLRAYWVSNRPGSTKLIEKAFSNDIYTHPLTRKAIIRINDLCPIFLYFDNDYPDPRSRDTITDKAYESLYQDFMAKRDEYIINYTKNSAEDRYEYDLQTMETFFTDLESEYLRLYLFAELLEVILRDGQDIVIIFKGYASPVGNTAYNEIVAKKRISCIQNFFYEFNEGVLNEYTKNESGSGKGSLQYGHKPIGEIKQENTFVKEDGSEESAISSRKQKWMSVYSPAAAYQRKIEIVAVNIEYEDELYEKIQKEIAEQKKTVEDDGSAVDPDTEPDEEFDDDTDSNSEELKKYEDEEIMRIK
jgi:hypothetical protein